MSLESIALIPSGYKATKVYSQLPVNGNGDFTYDRGTADQATRVNKNGLIEDVSQDVPRLDYLDGGCPSLLLEPATTNLITYSEDFSNASWDFLNNSTITTDQILSPYGSVNADLFSPTLDATATYIADSVSVTSGSDYTFSVFIKKGTLNYVQISCSTGFSGSVYQNYNVADGVLEDAFLDANTSSNIEDYGRGWYRIIFTSQATSTTATARMVLALVSDGEQSRFSGTGLLSTDNVYLYGAQVEQQSYATSYVRSLSGVSGVRNAETCNGAGTTAEINSQEGVLFFEGKTLEDDVESGRIALSDGTTNNYYSIDFRSTPDTLRIVYAEGGSNIIVENITNVMTTNNYNKLAFHYKTGDYRIYFNGLLIWLSSENNIFSSNVLNELEFSIGGGSPFYGRVKKISVYDDTTTDLEALTGFSSFAEMKNYLSYE